MHGLDVHHPSCWSCEATRLSPAAYKIVQVLCESAIVGCLRREGNCGACHAAPDMLSGASLVMKSDAFSHR